MEQRSNVVSIDVIRKRRMERNQQRKAAKVEAAKNARGFSHYRHRINNLIPAARAFADQYVEDVAHELGLKKELPSGKRVIDWVKAAPVWNEAFHTMMDEMAAERRLRRQSHQGLA